MKTFANPLAIQFMQAVTQRKKSLTALAFLFFATLSSLSSTAQSIDETFFGCNTNVNFVNGGNFNVSVLTGFMPEHTPVFPQRWTGNYGVNVGLVTGTASVVDANTANAATMSYILTVSGGKRITIQSNSGQIPAGYFAGFDISNAGVLDLTLLGSYSVKTYLGNTLQETVTGGSGLLSASLLNDNGISRIGFITTKAFDRIMLDQNQSISAGLSATQVYNVVLEKFCTESQPRPCNTLEYWKNPEFPVYVNPSNTGISSVVACVGCNISNLLNLTDANENNYASITMIGSLGASGSVSVKNIKTVYTAGTFAGFELDDNRVLGIGFGARHTITTFLGGVEQESITDGGGLIDGGIFTSGGRTVTGFKTSLPFDEIKLTVINALAIGVNPIRVYGAVTKNLCAGAALPCNTLTRISESTHSLFVDGKNTGINGVACLQCNIENAGNAIDTVPGNYTQITVPVGVATTAAYAVTDGATVYTSSPTQSYFAGFDIENPNLIDANILNGVFVATTLNGVVQQVADMNSGLLSVKASLLNEVGHQVVGFAPSVPFNGIKIIFSGLVNANIGITKIYSAVLEKFCENNLSCNALTALQNADYPVYVNGRRTGIDAVACVACQLNNPQNITAGNTTAPATLVMGTSVGSTASVSVANAIETYTAETFAGFDIESASLLSGDVLANMHITLYNNGVAVQSGVGDALLVGAGSSVITGGPNRQIVGIIGRVPFDEVQLNIQNLVGVDLGIIKIYKAYVQKSCALPVACNLSRVLNNSTDGAVINAAHTGVKGGICAGCLVNGPWDAVSADNNDYARMYNTASGLITNSLSVAVPAYTFPAGTFAGFSIRKNNFIIAADLFPFLTITTYNNGVVQESRTGGSLINLRVLLQIFGTQNACHIPGFYATKPFDEVRLTVSSLATALDQYIDIYGAYVDVRGATASLNLNCNLTNPDFSVTSVNVPVSASVATNDKTQAGATYGAAINVPEGVTNPSAALPVVNPDGTYTFVTTTAGVYQFEVSVCFAGNTTTCVKELLTITVLDNSPRGISNPPVANTDIATTAFNTPVTIHSLDNDTPGAPELDLVPSSVAISDMNGNTTGNTSHGGTATVDPVTGNITYTPATDFIGIDTIKYTVCDNQPVPKCASAYQIIRVLPPGAVNSVSAADDFYYLVANTGNLTVTTSNGVLHNDSDPEGDSFNAVVKDTTIAGKGRLQLAADGSFVFIPEPGFRGPVVVPYTILDAGSPMASASASINILVKAIVPDLTPSITVTPTTIHNTTNITLTVEIKEINDVHTSGPISVYLVKNRMVSLDFNPASVTINGLSVQNSRWNFDRTSNAGYYILTTNDVIPAGHKLAFGFTGVFTPNSSTGKINITTIINKTSGSEDNSANNLDADPINFFQN